MMLRTAFLLLSLAMLSACGGSSSEVLTHRSIRIPFEAVAGQTPITCGNPLQGLGTAGTDAELSDFKLFIHNVRLVTDEGVELPVQLDEVPGWQTDNIALLDFQDYDQCDTSSEDNAKPVNHTLHGQVADIDVVIRGIRFVVGVPVSHNHANAAEATAPLNTPSMHWTWQGGYKHFRADVTPLGSDKTWQFHLGDTDCSADPVGTCHYRNRPSIALDDYHEGDSVIRIDFAALVANVTLSEDAGGMFGCMSGITDPECGPTFASLGLVLGDADDPPSQQTVFSLVLNR